LRLFTLLILPVVAVLVLASVAVVDRNNEYTTARIASDIAALADNVARVDEALGEEALRAAQLVGPQAGDGDDRSVDAFRRSVASTNAELDELEAAMMTFTTHPDLATAAFTIRETLTYRSDIARSPLCR